MNQAAIEADIERIVNRLYSPWTIGVTDNPNRRKTEHDNPTYWHQWDADTEQAAR